MPEGLEAEIWRREIARRLVGRRLERVRLDERVVDPAVRAVVGERITGAGRLGKVVVVATTGASIGLRFGMTGRVVVDGVAPIDRLAYASAADRPEWDRLVIWTDDRADVPALRLNDPRRLGRVEVDPDLSALGPDALDLDRAALDDALAARRTTLKAALLNQSVVAGLGNLCVDEVLFAASIAPTATAGCLDDDRLDRLHQAIATRLPDMLRRGGSTDGVLDPGVRRALPTCPRPDCGGRLRRDRVGGRTTVWCPTHQRE